MKYYILMAYALLRRSIIWANKVNPRQPKVYNKRGMANLTSRYKYALYLDSKDINSIQILEKWFKYGFFDKRQAVVIFRYYPKTIFTFPIELSARGFDYIGYNKFFSISLGKLPAVFYPFNTNTNPVLIKQRQTRHVFIGHGESDKEASINPMIRMYDLIFSSGPSSTQRYIDHSIINKEDIGKRAFEIGMPYIDDQFKNKHTKKNDKMAIYCPTWEGANNNQQYSSLNYSTAKIIIETALQYFNELYFMPHPSTGIKDKAYLKDLTAILKHFSKHPNFIFIANSETQKNIAKENGVGYQVQEELNWHQVSTCITDISSMISIAAYFKCRVICMKKHTSTTNHLQSYVNTSIYTSNNEAINTSLLDAFTLKTQQYSDICNINTELKEFRSNIDFSSYLYTQYIKAPS